MKGNLTRRPDGRWIARPPHAILRCPVTGCTFRYAPADEAEYEFAMDMGCPTHGTKQDLEGLPNRPGAC